MTNLQPSNILVEFPCQTATNNLRLVYNKPEQQKKKFGVCVKGLNFPEEDISGRLVEWIELLLVLGADMIFFYKLIILTPMQIPNSCLPVQCTVLGVWKPIFRI